MNKDRRTPSRIAPSEQWLLTAGRRSARLLSVALTPHGRVHVEKRAEIIEEWDEFQHGRPSPRAGKDGHAYASPGHEDDERTHRFAKSVAAWLQRELAARHIGQVHAFTAPRLLGHLRSVLPSPIQGQLREHSLNLEHLTLGELAVHEAVIHALFSDPQADNKAPLNGTDALVARTQDKDTANKLALEHAATWSAIRDLRTELDRLRSDQGPAHPVGELAVMLRKFGHHLRRHFELEERGGYLDKLGGLNHEKEQLIEHLLAEHQSFDGSLVKLLDAAERAEDAQACLSDAFVQGLRDLLEGILRHEHAESALVGELVAHRAPTSL